jgi:putative ABC transport system permease protein
MPPFIARRRPPVESPSGDVGAYRLSEPLADSSAGTRRTWPLLRDLKPCVSVAVANLFDQRARLIAAVSGVAVSLFLLLLQISFVTAFSQKVTELYDDFDFDIVIVPDSYQIMLSFDTMNRIVLDIARATGDVADTYGLNVDVLRWKIVPTDAEGRSMLIGIDAPAGFVRDKAIRDAWPVLRTPHTLVSDRYSQKGAGPVTPGSVVEINDERLTMRGQFKLGQFFYSEGAALVRNVDFPRLTGRDPRNISIGLVKLNPGVSPEKAREDIAAALPSGTRVLTKSQLEKQERAYFFSTKPIGFIMDISMIISCLIGGVIILQVLSTEIANRMGEYAVLKAIGAGPALIYGIGLSQAAVVSFGGLAPALVLGWLVLAVVQMGTHLNTGLALPIVLEMCGITAVLAAAAAAIVVRRVDRADPASLY